MTARKKAGVIPQAGTLTGDEILAIVQNGNSRRTTAAAIAALAQAATPSGSVRRLTDADGTPGDVLTFSVLPTDIGGLVQVTATDELDPPRLMIIPAGEIGDRLQIQFALDPLTPVEAVQLLVLGAGPEAFSIVVDGVNGFYDGIAQGGTVEIVKAGTLDVPEEEGGPFTAHIWTIVSSHGGGGGGGIPAMNPVPAEGELVASDGAGGLEGTGSTVLEITDAIQTVQDAVDAISSPFPLDPVPTLGTVLITDSYGDPTTTTAFNPYALTTDQIVRGWGRLPAVADTSSAWRGTVGEMRGDVGEFVASALCDLDAVPVAAQDIWGNYELGTTTGGWGITVDTVGFGGVVSRDSDGALITLTPVANYAPFSAYPAGELIDRTALVTLQVIGTAATLWVNGQQAATATLTGGMRRADAALRAYVGRNNSAGTPRVATDVAVRGVYYYAAATNTQLHANWPSAQYAYVRARSGLLGGRAYGGTLNGDPAAADVFHVPSVASYLTQLTAASGAAGPLVHATGSTYVGDVPPVVWASLGTLKRLGNVFTLSASTVLDDSYSGGVIFTDTSGGARSHTIPTTVSAGWNAVFVREGANTLNIIGDGTMLMAGPAAVANAVAIAVDDGGVSVIRRSATKCWCAGVIS